MNKLNLYCIDKVTWWGQAKQNVTHRTWKPVRIFSYSAHTNTSWLFRLFLLQCGLVPFKERLSFTHWKWKLHEERHRVQTWKRFEPPNKRKDRTAPSPWNHHTWGFVPAQIPVRSGPTVLRLTEVNHFLRQRFYQPSRLQYYLYILVRPDRLMMHFIMVLTVLCVFVETLKVINSMTKD